MSPRVVLSESIPDAKRLSAQALGHMWPPRARRTHASGYTNGRLEEKLSESDARSTYKAAAKKNRERNAKRTSKVKWLRIITCISRTLLSLISTLHTLNIEREKAMFKF